MKWLLIRWSGLLMMIAGVSVLAASLDLDIGARIALLVAFVGTGIWATGAAKSLDD